MEDSHIPSRRSVLKATGVVALAGLGSGTSIAQTDDEDDTETHTLTVVAIGPDGEPVADADVGIVTWDGGNPSADGTTDENGEATFELPDGEYEIAVRTEGLVNPSDDRLVGIDGDDVERTIQLVEWGESEDTKTALIRVVDQDGNPVEGEPVTYGNSMLSDADSVDELHEPTVERTDENGEVRIVLAASDPTDVVPFLVGVRDQEQSITLDSDKNYGITEVVFTIDTSDDEDQDQDDEGDDEDGDEGDDEDDEGQDQDDASDADDDEQNGEEEPDDKPAGEGDTDEEPASTTDQNKDTGKDPDCPE